MTEEQVNAEFANVEMMFHSYFKYTFTFVGTADDGKTIEASFGGNKDDIYREDVRAGEGRPFKACDQWRMVTVKDGTREVFQQW